LRPEESILDNLLAESRYSLTELRNELAFYGFTASTVFQKVSTLSGGELLRASLAHMFLGSCLPELIVLDEPTNNLDLQSIALLEQAIIAFRGALIVISHDQEFARRIGIEDSLRLDSASTD
jgi:ATPase subunit of ABC transporter with duplicated ATPase domains